MKRFIATTTKYIAALCVAVFGMATLASAQNNQQPGGGQALEIGPTIINLKGDPGDTVKATISLRDVSPTKLIVTNQINDFTADGEDGVPKLLLNNEEAGPNSIIPWIKPLPQFTLTPKQVQELDLVVNIPKTAAPGGYYGVIRFTGIPPELEDTGVALNASIGTLVFVRVNGDAKESVAIEEFSVNDGGNPGWLFESTPLNFVLRLKNNGNVFESPEGKVTVTDMTGNAIGTLVFNQQKRNVLPTTIRKFEQPLDETVIGDKWLFGQYKAVAEVAYGTKGETMKSELTFWVIPYRLIAAIVIGLIALFLIIRYALKSYAARIRKQSRGGRR